MSSEAGFFGSKDRQLFGCLHRPVGPSRGGVVICSTLSVESHSVYPALQRLAVELEAAGFTVLRFDHFGTGNSDGSLESPSLVEQWVEGVGDAERLLRQLGAEPVAVVGVRVGATIAAAWCASHPGVRGLVLWDPLPSGRAFLREQDALRQLSIEPSAGASDEHDTTTRLLGMELPSEVTDALRCLELSPNGVGRHAERVLLLVREERSPPAAVVRQLERDDVDQVSVAGLSDLVDLLPDDRPLPLESIDAIASWLESQMPVGERRPLLPGQPLERHLVLSGGDVLEYPVSVGELGLFGMMTEPVVSTTLPALVFLNAGLLHHIGPARMWTDLARRLAAMGFRCLRFDLAGLGESPARPGRPRQVSYPLEAVEDARAALEWLSPNSPEDAVLIGLCSGAYHSAEAGIAFAPRGVVLLNPLFAFEPPEVQTGHALDSRRVAVHPYNPVVNKLRRLKVVQQLGGRFVPRTFWTLLDRLNLQASPTRALVDLARNGVDTLLVCGTMEAEPLVERGSAHLAALASSPRFTFRIFEGADHALFDVATRREVEELVVEHLLTRFASGSADGPVTAAVEATHPA